MEFAFGADDLCIGRPVVGALDEQAGGSHPKPLHQNAVRVMAERGIAISGRPSKSLARFARNKFDRVVTLCDKVREICPEFPGAPIATHWSIADPAASGDSDGATYPGFERVADEIEGRVALLLADLLASPLERTPRAGPRGPTREIRRVSSDIVFVVDAFDHPQPAERELHMTADLVSVRYLVDDVDAAFAFYTTHLGFTELTKFAPAFADVVRGNLRLLLSGPTSSAGRTLPDGRRPTAGGWNRIHLIVDDIASEVARLTQAGVNFRSEIVTGPGGSQILLDDPSGNPIELFQPAANPPSR